MSAWEIVVVLIAALAIVVVGVFARRRITAERRAAGVAAQRAAAAEQQLASERQAMAADLQVAQAERDAAQLAEVQATEQADTARREAEQAVTARLAADEAVAAAERRVAELAGALAQRAGDGVDPDLLWDLERARSERTWRHSVAVSPDEPSVFAAAADPLGVALQVELEAAREDVGAVVVLDVELPAGVTVAGSLLTLRIAQELLAGAVRIGDETILHVRPEGNDLLIGVRAVDATGAQLELPPLGARPGTATTNEDGVIRILGAIGPAPSS